nr:histidine phosphatase family protein [Gibbsiella quercinecans]
MNIKKGLFISLLAVSTVLINNADAAVEDSVNIYFARHGKTVLNTYDRVQGWVDSPLTAPGIETARYLGAGLKDISFSRYYTSDAGRQRETMQIILQEMGQPQAPVVALRGLREVFFGGFEGLPNADMLNATAKKLGFADSKAMLAAMTAGDITVPVVIDAISQIDEKQAAENAAQVKVRTQQALHTMVQDALKAGDKNVLAVSSGLSMLMMISDMTDSPAKNRPLANAAVVKITYKNGKYTVADIGDMQYVAKGKAALEKTP